MNTISQFVKSRRKLLKLTQDDLASKAGVALTVIRKIEQGKDNLSLSKVNQVLQMFGHIVGPISDKKEILEDLELQVDPTPLTKAEEAGLALYIKQLKEKKQNIKVNQSKFTE